MEEDMSCRLFVFLSVGLRLGMVWGILALTGCVISDELSVTQWTCDNEEGCLQHFSNPNEVLVCDAYDDSQRYTSKYGAFTCCPRKDGDYLRCEVNKNLRAAAQSNAFNPDLISQNLSPVWTFQSIGNPFFGDWIMGSNCPLGWTQDDITLKILDVEGCYIRFPSGLADNTPFTTSCEVKDTSAADPATVLQDSLEHVPCVAAPMKNR
jgi:hypothetical protein